VLAEIAKRNWSESARTHATATDAAFFEATRTQALRHWRFQPATRDGIPVESWRTMTVKFKLES